MEYGDARTFTRDEESSKKNRWMDLWSWLANSLRKRQNRLPHIRTISIWKRSKNSERQGTVCNAILNRFVKEKKQRMRMKIEITVDRKRKRNGLLCANSTRVRRIENRKWWGKERASDWTVVVRGDGAREISRHGRIHRRLARAARLSSSGARNR